MNKAKNIFNILLVFFSLVSLAMISYSIYYFKYKYKTTINSFNLNALSYVEDETYFMETKLFTNKNKNGRACFEFKVNYYTDTTVPREDDIEQTKNVYSSGFQSVDNIDWKFGYHTGFSENKDYYKPVNPYYYNTTNGTSYGAINELAPDNAWIIDFNGTLGLVKQKGYKKYKSGPFGFKYLMSYDINLFLMDLYNSICSLEKDGLQVLQFDCSKYFLGKVFNKDTQFEDVGKADYNYMIINIKVDKTDNGISNSSQSMFNMVANDSKYEYNNISMTDYWKTTSDITLSVKDFEYKSINGSDYEKLAVLKPKAIEYFFKFKMANIDVIINLDSGWLVDNQIILKGLDKNAFGNLKINSITITSSTAQEFILKDIYNNLILNNVTIKGGDV